MRKSADVVVIGGGSIGCSVAYNLAKKGFKNIVLLEKRYKAEKQLAVIENSAAYTPQDLYWALINFKTENILYMMALAKDEAIRKAISNFYTHQRNIKPTIKGRDLLKLGIKPGPVFTRIFNQVLNTKLDGQLKTKKDEINFAAAWARENKLID